MAIKRILLGVFLFALLAGQRTQVSAQGKFLLTIDNIMRGPELYGYAPQDVRWSGDNQRIYFQWKQASDPIDKPLDTWMIPRDSGYPRKLNDEDAKTAPPASGDSTRDRKRTVYVRDGDVFLYDFTSDKARQLTKTTDAEKDPHFTQDEKRVVFTRGGNLYILALEGGALEQMTDIKPAAVAPETKPAGDKVPETSQDFLKKQEKELLAAVRDRVRLKDAEEARKKRENPRKPFELAERQSVKSLELCPSQKCVIAVVEEGPKGDKPDNVPNYVTESGYTEEIKGRTNVGDPQERTRVAILDSLTGEAQWADPGLGDRQIDLDLPLFNEQGTRAVMVARSVDNKDRWIQSLDTASAKTTTLFHEHDDAWLDGPGYETLGWLKSGDEIYFESERDGWDHLYKVSALGGDPKQLTSGKFEVTSVELSEDGSKFYLTTSEAGAPERHFYSMSVNGGPRTRITTQPGGHRVVLSRDEKYLADVYSYMNRPPEIYTGENEAGAKEEKRTDSPSKDFWDYAWQDAPIVQVPAREGAMIPARWFKPANYRPGGPAVVFVHGAGYLQNVLKSWSPNYPREYLFHHFLMEHGYMVLDMDYRASAGYGRDWRTAIYRHMGGKDLEDNIDGAKWLIAQGADPKRIGIYGGSYGGFITLMAMFTSPDTFAAGAALRPVTDWAHYNHGYTSNILNTPQADEEAFRKSSPIYFAEGLKGALLICHGMVDTNVFFQDTVRLVQRLVELRKENWSVAMYPVENHGFVRPESWADEYKRIFKLFEDNLNRERQ
ncbi:MAG: peptidase prolyl oligopeptidase active site domain protein [Bryobacterales bacterium]|nr:peptidase prolyl oligopeptidase active site domain protein [Bryobacterales bacterium]